MTRLAGEGGNDTYVVQLGDGIVTINDIAEDDAGNVLRFGPGIDPDELRNNLRYETDGNGGHVLLIPYGDDGDVVRLTGFDPRDVLGNHAIERFEFADGTAVDYATLVSWAFVVEGDNAGDAHSKVPTSATGSTVTTATMSWNRAMARTCLPVVWVTMSCWVARSATPTWSTWAMART